MFIPAIAFTGSYYIARCADQGLADFLGLQTLRHGTNPISWIAIHIMGALPKMGGSAIGGDKGYCDSQNKNYFYTQGDIEPDKYCRDYLQIRAWNILSQRGIPKTYAVASTFNLLTGGRYKSFITQRKFRVILRVCAAPILAAGLVLPTIKFRMSDRKICNMERDPTMEGAYRTHAWQHPLRIGLIGTIWASCTYKTPARMYQNPDRVLKGVALMAISGAAAACCATTFAPLIVTHQFVLLAGIGLAVI